MGGAALLVLALIAFLWLRSQTAHERDQVGGHERPPLPPAVRQPIPFNPNPIYPDPISPHTRHTPRTPLTSGSRDTAPLMAHRNSMYSSHGGSVPNSPGTSQFASDNPYRANSGYQDNQPPASALPTAARQGSIAATSYTGSSSTPSAPITSPRSGGAWSGARTSSGVMAPRVGTISGPRLNEKGRFPSSSTLAPSRPTTVVPPPSSQGG